MIDNLACQGLLRASNSVLTSRQPTPSSAKQHALILNHYPSSSEFPSDPVHNPFIRAYLFNSSPLGLNSEPEIECLRLRGQVSTPLRTLHHVPITHPNSSSASSTITNAQAALDGSERLTWGVVQVRRHFCQACAALQLLRMKRLLCDCLNYLDGIWIKGF